ncbi:MAG: glycosyltransferase family A protein [Nitrospirota bacterium]
MAHAHYVLITPARNEEAYIEKTLRSVIAQTVLPSKWVIVSDGSTDGTDEIVQKYAAHYSFIRLVKAQEQGQRNFGSKVSAFKAGYDSLGDVNYEFLGNLDADVSFKPDYYENILGRLQRDARLGIAGGIIVELINNRFVPQKNSTNSVAGAIQLFRRACYEEIGGYISIESGGIDSAAEIMARSLGWKVQTFCELEVFHHRRVASVGTHILKARYRQGITHYLLGYHPLFHLIKCAYRSTEKPYVLGSLFVLCGYFRSSLLRLQRPMPAYAIRYFRQEQMERVRSVFRVLKVRAKKA